MCGETKQVPWLTFSSVGQEIKKLVLISNTADTLVQAVSLMMQKAAAQKAIDANPAAGTYPIALAITHVMYARLQ
jgi:hypothetical protein